MTAGGLRLALSGIGGPLRALGPAWRIALLVGAAAAAGLFAVATPGLYRAALALALAVNLIVLGMKWPRAAALTTLLFLPFLALVRRILIPTSGFTSNDPLLLVGPVVVLFLLYRLYVVERRERDPDLMFKLVLALLVVVVIQVFNPLGTGGIIAAASGLLFLGVPLLWFFVGRSLADERTVKLILYGAILVAGVVGIYGLFQTQLGDPISWDQQWIDINGYSALSVGRSETGNQLRPFSTFSSNQEYAAFLAVGVTFIAALMFHRRLGMALVLPLIAVALFLAGGRGSLVLAVLSLVMLAALRTRALLPGFVVVVMGVGLAFGLATAFGPRLDRAAGLGGDALVERNVSGIFNPLDPNKSTVIAHWDLIIDGFVTGVTNPAGQGTAATNIAVTLSPGSDKQDSENDIANAFVSLGLAGGLLYVAIIFLVFRGLFSRYVARRDVLSFAAVGLIVVTFGQWLNGGLYALAPLLWFFVGWATRPPPEPAENPAPAG